MAALAARAWSAPIAETDIKAAITAYSTVAEPLWFVSSRSMVCMRFSLAAAIAKLPQGASALLLSY